jgi:hypothetical protein
VRERARRVKFSFYIVITQYHFRPREGEKIRLEYESRIINKLHEREIKMKNLFKRVYGNLKGMRRKAGGEKKLQ